MRIGRICDHQDPCRKEGQLLGRNIGDTIKALDSMTSKMPSNRGIT